MNYIASLKYLAAAIIPILNPKKYLSQKLKPDAGDYRCSWPFFNPKKTKPSCNVAAPSFWSQPRYLLDI